MSTKPPGAELPIRRIDRFLAFLAGGLLLLSLVCVAALIAARPLGVTDYTSGIWPLVGVFPLLGLPVAMLCVFALLIMSFVRRSRANRAR